MIKEEKLYKKKWHEYMPMDCFFFSVNRKWCNYYWVESILLLLVFDLKYFDKKNNTFNDIFNNSFLLRKWKIIFTHIYIYIYINVYLNSSEKKVVKQIQLIYSSCMIIRLIKSVFFAEILIETILKSDYLHRSIWRIGREWMSIKIF